MFADHSIDVTRYYMYHQFVLQSHYLAAVQKDEPVNYLAKEKIYCTSFRQSINTERIFQSILSSMTLSS